MGTEPEPLDIPSFLKRDTSNKAEFMMASDVVEREDEAPAKAKRGPKPNGVVKLVVKAAGKAKAKPAAKAAPKPEKAPKAAVKAAKGKTAKAKSEPAEKDQFGLRKGSTKSKAAAMYARKNGATLAEVKDALGSVQLNVLVGLEEDGFTVKREKETRDGQRPVTRYMLKAK